MKDKFFYKKVDKRSRLNMTWFLIEHFRYDTMNSWNLSTSWANNMKVDRCIPREFQDKVFEMLEISDFYDEINELISDYNRNNNFEYQAGFNGRSGGYLVMYHGYRKQKPYLDESKIKAIEDGQRVYIADGIGWRDGDEARAYIGKVKTTVGSWPGKSVDYYDPFEYEEMEMSELREIVNRVQEFDLLCDEIRDLTIYMAQNCEVKDEEYIVTKTRKVLT